MARFDVKIGDLRRKTLIFDIKRTFFASVVKKHRISLCERLSNYSVINEESLMTHLVKTLTLLTAAFATTGATAQLTTS